MIFRIKYLFLLIAFASAEKPTDLEDIERDTLLSEQRSNNVKESLATDQTQHLRPPINAVSSSSPYEKTDDPTGNDVVDDIAYAPQTNTGVDEYDAQQQIQYVTPQQYEEVKQAYSPVHPVHEAHHTYSAPARQSLITPIVAKQNPSPSPYLAQQPRYVYVQAGPQQVSSNGVLTYAPHQRPAADHGQPHHEQQDIAYASVGPAPATAIQPPVVGPIAIGGHRPAANYGPPSPPTHNNYVQYVPWLTQTPNHQQSYFMVLPYRNVPTHTQAIIIPQAPFTYTLRQQHSPHTLPLTATSAGGIAPAPHQSTVAYAHSGAADASGPVLHTPDATVAPALPAVGHLGPAFLQYRPSPYTAAHPAIHYAQQPLHVQQSIPYELPQQQSIVYHQPRPLLPQQHQQQQQHYLSPSPPLQSIHHAFGATNLDFFAPYGKQPTSLLESYVPSSVILARQRALQSRQILHPVGGGGTNAIIQGNHQPGYNTIAYSTYQGYTYAKRSPKAVTTTTRVVASASENVPVTVNSNNVGNGSSTSTSSSVDTTKAQKNN